MTVMRRLSPREIHLTSPRYMTPRTAQKIANHTTNADLPRVSNARELGRSPLAPVAELRTPSMDVNSDSGSDYGDEETHETYETRRSMASRDEEAEDEQLTPQDRQDAWPTLPRHSPVSPNASNLSSFSIAPTSLRLVPVSRPPLRPSSVCRKPMNLPSQPKAENGFLAVLLDHLAQGLSNTEPCRMLCRASM